VFFMVELLGCILNLQSRVYCGSVVKNTTKQLYYKKNTWYVHHHDMSY